MKYDEYGIFQKLDDHRICRNNSLGNLAIDRRAPFFISIIKKDSKKLVFGRILCDTKGIRCRGTAKLLKNL